MSQPSDDTDEFDKAFAEATARNGAPIEEAVDDVFDEPKEDPQPAKPADEPTEAERLRADLAKAQHEERSSANRLSHFMKSENQLRKQVQELAAELERVKAEKTAPAKEPEPAEDVNDVLADAPDLSAAIDRRIKERTSKLEGALETANKRLAEVGEQVVSAARDIEPLTSREKQQRIEATFGVFDKTFGEGWREDIKTDRFKSWLADQSEPIQWSFHKGQSEKDGMAVLRLFYTETGAPKQGEPRPQAGTTSNEQRLRASAGVRSRPAIRQGVDPDDFEGAFREFSAKKLRPSR